MSEKVVISGIGFVHPAGVGSREADLSFPAVGGFDASRLGGGKCLYSHDVPPMSHLAEYPDKRMRRTMRPDAVAAYVAAVLAIEDSRLGDFDHQDTSLHAGVGQSYADMWPFIREGIAASTKDGTFDMSRFSRRGFQRIYPFFSTRALPALPLALIAERFGLRGENSVHSSFGAESVVALEHGVRDIKWGKTKLVLVGSADCASNPHTIENLYFNDFYVGDFYGSTSSCFVVLEDDEHNRRRGGKSYGEIVHLEHKSLGVAAGNVIDYRREPFVGICSEAPVARVDDVVINPSGTKGNFEAEVAGARRCFPGARHRSYFDSCGGLLAAGEPFGAALVALGLDRREEGVSLSRSVCGSEGAVVVSRVSSHA